MGKRRLIPLSMSCVVVAVFIAVSVAMSAQVQPLPPPNGGGPFYNTYPQGILPADLESEIARVRLEINRIFRTALADARALTPPVLTGQPPTLQGTGYQAVQILGKILNFDENMSPFRTWPCVFSHMPYAGFNGPIPSVNLTMLAYPGSEEFRAGKRN